MIRRASSNPALTGVYSCICSALHRCALSWLKGFSVRLCRCHFGSDGHICWSVPSIATTCSDNKPLIFWVKLNFHGAQTWNIGIKTQIREYATEIPAAFYTKHSMEIFFFLCEKHCCLLRSKSNQHSHQHQSFLSKVKYFYDLRPN